MSNTKRISRKSYINKEGKSKIGWIALSVMMGTLATVILLLLTALVIKNFSPSNGVISIITTVIKMFGAFVTVNTALRKVDMQPLLLGGISGVLFILISSVLFLSLGGTQFDLRTFFVDLLIGLASGVLFGLVLNRKSLYAGKK